jgi:hypothetical protein
VIQSSLDGFARPVRKERGIGEEVTGHTDPEAADACLKGGTVIWHGAINACFVPGIVAGHHAEGDGCVLHAPRERPDMVERGREGEHTAARYTAEGGL